MKYDIERSIQLDFYTEGPCVGPSGEMFFTNLSGKQIIELLPNNEVKTWAHGNCPNGQLITPAGQHWVCESLSGSIAAYHADGSLAEYIVQNTCGGIEVKTPNDLVLDRQGNLYFTDSLQHEGKVFYRSASGEGKCLAFDLHYANGIALNNAETLLYVAESYANRVRVYTVQSPGILANDYHYISLPSHASGDPIKNLPDGLAIDAEDRLWVAHYGMQAIQVIQADGTLLGSIDTGLPLTSNLTFLTDTPTAKRLLVTGGYGEPGPGGTVILSVLFE